MASGPQFGGVHSHEHHLGVGCVEMVVREDGDDAPHLEIIDANQAAVFARQPCA